MASTTIPRHPQVTALVSAITQPPGPPYASRWPPVNAARLLSMDGALVPRLPFRRMKILVGALVLTSASCSVGVKLVLKEPVASKCRETGLKGCSEMTEGVLEYVGGEKGDGREKILNGAAENAPEQVHAFADAITALGAIPGASDYMGPVLEIANLLKSAKTKKAEAAPVATAIPAATVVAVPVFPTTAIKVLTADTDPARIEGGQVAPMVDPTKLPCGGAFGGAVSFCTRVVLGPFVVTDLQALPGCPVDTFAAAAPLGAPRWLVLNPSAHGARLAVKAGESLTLGVAGSTATKLSKAAHCSIAWSGFAPYAGPTPTAPGY